MNAVADIFAPEPGGIHIHGITVRDVESARTSLLAHLERLGLGRHVKTRDVAAGVVFGLRDELADSYAPEHDTIRLGEKLGLDSQGNLDDLEREILFSLLLSPVPFRFPSYAELASSVRVRKNIVAAARKTTLAFDTGGAERPADYWTYAEGCGFTLLPGRPLIEALKAATQPDESGKLYSFSCYRASEYVMLLGIAQELDVCNPELLAKLQQQCEKCAILSGKFHEVFLKEYGSMTEPLPLCYFVPGDRTWFRNPDDYSSDVIGYEGSWVIYLGGGLFTNFWKKDQPYSLTTKCVELYHWRNATFRGPDGQLLIDEDIVEQRVSASMRDPAEIAHILRIMLRLREPKGVYIDGGCIDTSREYSRWVCPGMSDLVLPDH